MCNNFKLHTHYILLTITALSLLQFPITLFSQQDRSNHPYHTSVYKKIADENLKSITRKSDSWSCDNLYDWARISFQKLENPRVHDTRTEAFEVIGLPAAQKAHAALTIVDPTTQSNLNLLCGSAPDVPYIGSVINRTQTEIGFASLLTMLSINQTHETQILEKRQAIIHELVSNQTLFEPLYQAYTQLHKSEKYLMPLLRIEHNGPVQHMFFDLPYLQALDRSPFLMQIKTLSFYGTFSMATASTFIAAFALPLYAIHIAWNGKAHPIAQKIKNNLVGAGGHFEHMINLLASTTDNPIALSACSAIIGIHYGLIAPKTWLETKGIFLINYNIQKQILKVNSYLKNAQKIATLIKNNPILEKNFAGELALLQRFNQSPDNSADLNQLLALARTLPSRIKKPSYIPNGEVFVAYKLFRSLAATDELLPLLGALGTLEAYLSVATLYKEFQGKQVSYCFADFKQSDTPFMILKDFWNPLIHSETVVTNSLKLGVDGATRNIIITGPNAGGKSSILKSIAINCILAQTFGIVAAQEAIITPYRTIMSHLNIVDDIATGNSYFKAEVLRAQELIKAQQNLASGEHLLIIMDELFNGTTPIEGSATAFSFVKHLGAQPNIISLTATHFLLLTQLAHETTDFNNYKVSVNQTKNGKINYKFKLEPGIADQHIALDILREEGFNSAILDTAQNIIKNAPTNQTSFPLPNYNVTFSCVFYTLPSDI